MASASRIATVIGGAVGAVVLTASLSLAQDAGLEAAPEPEAGQAVDFADPQGAIEAAGRGVALNYGETAPRFSHPSLANESGAASPRRFEVELAAGAGVDVSIAQRATFGADVNGDIDRQGRGSEVRIGRGLVQERESVPGRSSVYMFVASDNEALTWSPGARAEGAGPSIALQDRVEMGDLSAGVTFEHRGVQASVAYVEREISTTVGRDSYSREENFAGVTVTMRR